MCECVRERERVYGWENLMVRREGGIIQLVLFLSREMKAG